MATLTSSAAAAATSPANRAPPQGGILEGADPSVYDPKNPINLFIIQAGLIITICYALHWPLAKIRQPRVIAEVIGGIILGPSVMGRIPHFRETIFPAASLVNLNLFANVGLVLYLFLIGLETDVRFLVSNWRVATSVAFAGLALPFGAGCGLAWGVYNTFHDEPDLKPIKFSVYMLFVGIAIAITAFPVLCRILTALKLLDTSVGIITLSAGVANDVVGWILLALCVALVNAGNGLTALWILLVCVGYTLVLFYVVKPALVWYLNRSGHVKNGPSQGAIAVILLVALASAFFTAIIGVHAIFGGFMIGLILPRENRFNIRVTEKLEDLIGALFLPLYFTLSGLNTNLGLLDSGKAWGYVFAITIVALVTKIIGASLAARFNGLVWRESFAIGVLMSCKGLVELIVLNIGLQAKILSQRTFTIFVVMALVTTFITTPAVSFLYPPSYQIKLEAWKRGEIDWDTGAPIRSSIGTSVDEERPKLDRVKRLLVYLRLDNMPALLNLLSMFGGAQGVETQSFVSEEESKGAVISEAPRGPVRAHGIRLLELTDRDSSVMTVAQVDEYTRHDPVVNTFRAVGQLNNVATSGEVAIIPEDRFAEALTTRSSKMSSDLLLLPWSETGTIGDAQFLSSAKVDDKINPSYTEFVKSVLSSNDHNVAVYFSRSSDDVESKNQGRAKLVRAHSYDVSKPDFPTAPLTNKPFHIFLVYFGGHDDKVALNLVLQLCEKTKVTAKIVHVLESNEGSSANRDNYFETVSAQVSADIATRVKFDTLPISTNIEELLQYADSDANLDHSDSNKPSLIVLSRHGGANMDKGKLTRTPKEDAQSCLGVIAGHLIASSVTTDLLVVQAKSSLAVGST